MPEPLQAIEPWPDSRVEVECERARTQPTRLDRIQALDEFVAAQCHALGARGRSEGFAMQQMWNHQPAGPVHAAAAAALPSIAQPLLLRRWPADALFDPRPALVRTLDGHTDHVTAVALAETGHRAVSVGSDLTLRVWDVDSGRCLRSVADAHGVAAWALAVTPDGRRALSSGWDRTLRLWDTDTGVCLHDLEGNADWIAAIDIAADGARAISAGNDGTLRLWDLESGACLRTLSERSRPDRRRGHQP